MSFKIATFLIRRVHLLVMCKFACEDLIMLTDERYKQLMADVGMPESLSLLQALKQAALEGSIRNAPCERFCEATAFNAEIRKLKAKIKDADYLIGAFERGCVSGDYFMDIANYKGT